MLPRSRLSVFVPSPRQPVTSSPENSLTDRSSLSPMCLSNKSSRIESSTLKNGSTISSLVTYANCVKDTVEKAIVSQQDSIASKLVEIADSLIVLPGLTQKIGDLVRKVEALEVLLTERTAQLHATQKECEQLREVVSKTDVILTKLAELENTLACLKSASTFQGVSNSMRSHKDNNDRSVNGQLVNFPPVEKSCEGLTLQYCRQRTMDLVTKEPVSLDRKKYRSSVDRQNNAETTAEIIVSHIFSGTEKQRADVVLAVLSTVLPSIERDDITSIRLLRAEK